MTIGYISHADCLHHEMGDKHPERPARLRAVRDHLIACGLDAVLSTTMRPGLPESNC